MRVTGESLCQQLLNLSDDLWWRRWLMNNSGRAAIVIALCIRGVQHEGDASGLELRAQVTVVLVEHGGRKVRNIGQVRMGVPGYYYCGPLCLKRSSQAVRDHPDPLHDQDGATLKGIVVGHCICP